MSWVMKRQNRVFEQKAKGGNGVRAVPQSGRSSNTGAHQEQHVPSNKQLAHVLQIYNERGPLDADDALDIITEDILKSGKTVNKSITELQTILRFELGHEVIHPSDPWVHSFTKVINLCDAICCYSSFIRCLVKRPKTALELAKQLISYNKPNSTSLPRNWIQQAESHVDEHSLKNDSTKIKIAQLNLSAQECWQRVLQSDPRAPPVMGDILRMVGIEEVKSAFVSQYYRIKVAKDQGDRCAFSYNACLEGNPGTGKTTIARKYCQFLRQLEVLPDKSIFIEASGSSISYHGISYVEKNLVELQKVGGGVIFIDEAYQLIIDKEGMKVLDFIIPLAEGLDTQYGSIVWVFAGYPKDIEKLLAHNAGLPSRFPVRFVFKDYSNEQLMEIFKSLLIHEQSSGSMVRKVESKPIEFQIQASGSARDEEIDVAITSKSKAGDKQKDRFGNTWTFDGKMWHDEFGSCSGYGPRSIGSTNNPLISVDFQAWRYNPENQTWQNNLGASMTRYPGNPQHSGSHAQRRTIPFRCEDEKCIRIAMSRLGRQRGRIGFGNARAVQTFFDRVRSRQADRIMRAKHKGESTDVFLFQREDLLGPTVTEISIKSCKAYKELQSLEGLVPVKQAVDDMIKLSVKNAQREEEELPVLDIVINRIFLGNPGTGKTTVAKLQVYGQLLIEMGLLSKGKVLFRNPSDFVGDVMGSSERNTRDILKAAEGCVLVIDEAYSLYSGSTIGQGNSSYNTAVINTIVEQVQATPGDDRAVLLLGYTSEMEMMLKNVNPGLSRRFQLEFAFHFPDYDDQALLRILMLKIRKDKLKIDFQVAKQAVAALAKARAKPHFGNAGSVENLLSEAKLRCKSADGVLQLSDFGLLPKGVDDDVLNTLFSDVVGCKNVKARLQTLRETILFAQSRGDNPKELISFNYIFVGNSGTGKTTVAQRMGKMFKALGLLPDDTVHNISPSDFLTGYMGHTAKKTREVLQRSLGSVLLIDEAYQLNPARGGNYMTEAVDELVRCLTSPEFEGKMLVILAGYADEVDQMLSINQGLQSRFSERLEFENLSAQETADLMVLKMKSKKLPVQDKDKDSLTAIADRLVQAPGFANGRDVETWSSIAYQEVSRSAGITQKREHVSLTEISNAVNTLMRKRHSSRTTCPPAGIKLMESPLLESLQVRKQQQDTFVQRAEVLQQAESTATSKVETSPTSHQVVASAKREFNSFQGVEKSTLDDIQLFLDSSNLNSAKGVAELAKATASQDWFRALVGWLTSRGKTPEQATKDVENWQRGHKELEDQIAAQTQSRSGVQAIWRCAVCGRADKPWIECFVAPFILRYERVITYNTVCAECGALHKRPNKHQVTIEKCQPSALVCSDIEVDQQRNYRNLLS